MRLSVVTHVGEDEIVFDHGRYILTYEHEQDCCESHYLSFKHLDKDDFEGLEFDLSNSSFFEKVEDYGIRLIPVSGGHPISVPGYGYNNGYYSPDLTLILIEEGKEIGRYDITDCQKHVD